MKKEFYIQRKPRAFFGNSPVWWAKGGNGYTAYILGAERFPEKRASKMVADNPEKWAAFECSEIDRRLHLIFDFQDVKNLGTNNPCGWAGGYAQSQGSYAIEAFNALDNAVSKNIELASALKAVLALMGEGEQIAKIINDVLTECEL